MWKINHRGQNYIQRQKTAFAVVKRVFDSSGDSGGEEKKINAECILEFLLTELGLMNWVCR